MADILGPEAAENFRADLAEYLDMSTHPACIVGNLWVSKLLKELLEQGDERGRDLLRSLRADAKRRHTPP